MDDYRKRVSEVNPEQYKLLLKLEAKAESEDGFCTYVWADTYGHSIMSGSCRGYADAMAHCMRTSMTSNGWIAGPHRFTPDKFIVVRDVHRVNEELIKLVDNLWGPRVTNLPLKGRSHKGEVK